MMRSGLAAKAVVHAARRERGQITILAALTLAVMLGFVALAVDSAFFFRTERGAQKDSDAMALAGVRDLPEEDTAKDIAEEWGFKNDVTVQEIMDIQVGTTCSGASLSNTLTVRLKRNQKTFLASLLGVSDVDLGACSTARKGVAAAGDALMPFGFHHTDPYDEDPNPNNTCFFYTQDGDVNPDLWGEECEIKIPKIDESWASGNSGPIRLDEGGEAGNYDPSCNSGNSGASEYKENIKEGSECYYAVDDEVRPKTGNMRGPTCSAFEEELDGNSETLEDVFVDSNNDGIYDVINMDSPRFGLIPIVTASGQGSSADVTILGFVTAYIENACVEDDCDGNGNNPACVVVTPVHSELFLTGIEFAGGSSTTYDADNPLRTIKLVE